MKQLFVAVTAIVLAACGGSSPLVPSSSAAPLDQTAQSEHFVYHFTAGDRVDPVLQEEIHAWAMRALDMGFSGRITYNKYTSEAHMRAHTGQGGDGVTGFAPTGQLTIHTIWPVDSHESVHVYTDAWGNPPALLSEGVAVAHTLVYQRRDYVPSWGGVPVHDAVRATIRQGQYIELRRIAQTAAFRQFPGGITYGEAGSLARYLIDTYGLPLFRQVYARVHLDSRADDVSNGFQATYGKSLWLIEQEWLGFLEAGG